jgi:Secretion system C-terminal sorting domain
MKRLIFTFLIACSYVSVYAQLPPGFYDNAPCQLRVNNTTDPFDWRQDKYDLYLKSGVRLGHPSPWYTFNNGNIDFFRLQQVKDWDQADGWELVQRDFGTPQSLINHAYIILYNKYTGILRIFVAIGEVDNRYNKASISISYNRNPNESPDIKRTAVLERYTAQAGQGALDNFDNQVDPAKVSNIYNFNLPWWLYADFVMTYDPCTCNSLSQIQFTVELLEKADLTFNLNGTAIQQGTFGAAGEGRGGLQTLVKNTQGAVDAGVGLYSSVNSGVETLDKIFKIKDKASQTGLVNLGLDIQVPAPTGQALKFGKISKALEKLPAIGAAVGAVNFLVGLFNGQEESKPTPMAFDIDLKGTGELNFQGKPLTVTTENPGSRNQQILNPPTKIQYNNVMGLFNVLTTPEVKYTTFSTNGAFTYHCKLSRDIEYVINPAAGFNSQTRLSAAIVFEYDELQIPDSQLALSGNIRDLSFTLVKETPRRYRTVFVPLDCLKDLQVDFWPSTYSRPNVSVLIVAAFQTNQPDSKEVLFTSKYRATYKYQTYTWDEFQMPPTLTKFSIPVENITLNQYAIDQNNTYASDPYGVYVVNTISLLSGTNVIPKFNQPFTLQAKTVVIGENTLIGANVILKAGRIIPDCNSQLQQASPDRIKEFCKSSVYTNKANNTRFAETNKKEDKNERFLSILYAAYPNPATQTTTFTYSLAEAANVTLYLSDMLGNRVATVIGGLQQEAGEHTTDYNVSGLAAGVYLYTLQTGSYKETKRLIIAR